MTKIKVGQVLLYYQFLNDTPLNFTVTQVDKVNRVIKGSLQCKDQEPEFDFPIDKLNSTTGVLFTSEKLHAKIANRVKKAKEKWQKKAKTYYFMGNEIKMPCGPEEARKVIAEQIDSSILKAKYRPQENGGVFYFGV